MKTRHVRNKKQDLVGAVVLSDVDGTIVRGSLVLDHAVYLHDEGIIDLGVLPSQWLVDRKNEGLIARLAEQYRKNITGFSVADLRVDEFLDSYLNSPDAFYSVFYRLVAYRNRGASVLLISGSPDYLVENFANRFGFIGIGSVYVTNSNGVISGDIKGMFSASSKREVVCSLRGRHIARAFGDTKSDFPLIESAEVGYLVEPNESTLRVAPHGVRQISR